MPPAIGGFFLGLGGFVTAGLGVTLGPAALIAIGVTTVVVGGYALRRTASLLNPEEVARPSSIGIVVRGTDVPVNIVYGESLVGGVLTFTNVHGPDTQFRALFYEVVHTGHEIDSYVGWRIDHRTVYLADVDDINAAGNGAVEADTNSHGIGPVGSATMAYLRGWLGTSGQTADSALTVLFPEVTSDHRHRGCARTVARFDVVSGAEQVWDGRAPSPPQAIIRGKKVYDPRQDGTLGYSPDGGHRVGTPSTWEWSDNPALCLSDYLIDTRLGPGLETDRIDWSSVAAAADICDALVQVPPAASPANTEKRFTCNLTVDTGMEHATIIQQILDTMAGRLQYFNGKFRIYAAAFEAGSFALDDTDLIANYTWQKQPSTTRGDRYNQVKGTYIDPLRNWKVSPFITVDDTTLRANRDNDRVLTSELSLPGVTGEYQAQRLAMLALNQADATGILEFPTGYQGANIRVGDTGTVTLEHLNFAAKTFRCVGVTYVDFQGVTLILKEDSSGNYDDPAVGDYGTRTAAGVIEFPRIRAALAADQNLVADPFISRSVELWEGEAADPGNHRKYFWQKGEDDNSTVTISRTGGVSGDGVLVLSSLADVTQNNSCTAISIPREAQIGIAGEYVICTVRLRRTSGALSSPSPDQTCIILQAGLGDYDGIGNFGNEPAYTLSHAQVNAWTTNQWQQISFYQQLGLLTLTAFSGQYCLAQIVVNTATDDLVIEVDSFAVARAPDPAL